MKPDCPNCHHDLHQGPCLQVCGLLTWNQALHAMVDGKTVRQPQWADKTLRVYLTDRLQPFFRTDKGEADKYVGDFNLTEFLITDKWQIYIPQPIKPKTEILTRFVVTLHYVDVMAVSTTGHHFDTRDQAYAYGELRINYGDVFSFSITEVYEKA